ncbi:MAG TPA: L,D-transpeptidase [Xanthobacteraceae bacterium]|nr:L,D-transpeptidase [Xanthobacteraceae bacterium]
MAEVNLSRQTMMVSVDGVVHHVWPVSTGKGGWRTPTGTFRPQSMHVRHFSSLFHGAPMPYSIFFHGHFAIHGTTEVRNLGRRASHGCVRLHPVNARTLFELIKGQGPGNARILVTG